MLDENRRRIESDLANDDLVLDIGGWVKPWTRADVVVDALPYATRGVSGVEGDDPRERFDASTWIIADVNRRLPFADKQFDFVTCSHVLEDIRDPIGLCEEMMRVGRAGYLETPSRRVEITFGFDGRGYAGYYHHRWLVETTESGVSFRPKFAFLHGSRRYRLPRSTLNDITDAERVTWLFWTDRFDVEEIFTASRRSAAREYEDFRRRFGPPNPVAIVAENPRAALDELVRSSPLLRRLASIVARHPITADPPDRWAVEPDQSL